MNLTPQERAKKLVDERGGMWCGYAALDDDTTSSDIATAIRAAVESIEVTPAMVEAAYQVLIYKYDPDDYSGERRKAVKKALEAALRSRSEPTR